MTIVINNKYTLQTFVCKDHFLESFPIGCQIKYLHTLMRFPLPKN